MFSSVPAEILGLVAGWGFLLIVAAFCFPIRSSYQKPIGKGKIVTTAYIRAGEHTLELAGYTARHGYKRPSFPVEEGRCEKTVALKAGRHYQIIFDRKRKIFNINEGK